MPQTLIPCNDKILVKPTPQRTTVGNIIIPDTAQKDKSHTGTVVAVGPGKYSDKGFLIPMTLKVGDKVLFSKNGFDEFEIDGESLYLMSESAVIGKFT